MNNISLFNVNTSNVVKTSSRKGSASQKKDEMIELDKDTLGNKINKADNVLTKFKLIMSLENNSHIISVKPHD